MEYVAQPFFHHPFRVFLVSSEAFCKRLQSFFFLRWVRLFILFKVLGGRVTTFLTHTILS